MYDHSPESVYIQTTALPCAGPNVWGGKMAYTTANAMKRDWEQNGSQVLKQMTLKPYTMGDGSAWEVFEVSPPASWQFWRWKRGTVPDGSIVHVVAAVPHQGKTVISGALLKFELGQDLPGKLCQLQDSSVVAILDCKQVIRFWPGSPA